MATALDYTVVPWRHRKWVAPCGLIVRGPAKAPPSHLNCLANPGIAKPVKSSIQPNHRLLVVDDNPAIHEDFKKILSPARASNSSLEDAKRSLFGRPSRPNSLAEFQIDS